MYIQYPIAFPDDVTQDGSALDLVLVLLDLGSEINAIHTIFAEKFGFMMQTTNVGAQKIDGTTLEIYKMVVAVFSVTGKADRVKFFKETFLMANVSPDVVFGMPIFTLNGADIDFLEKKL